jgi:hypothetical protein
VLRGSCRLAALAVAAASLARAGTAGAQEIQVTGPIGPKPPAILAGKKPYRVRRLHLAAEIAGTSNAVVRTGLAGARATYHPSEWVGVGVWGAYAFHATTAYTDQLQAAIDQRACDRAPSSPMCMATADTLTRAGTNPDGTRRTGRLLDDQLGRLTWLVAPQLTFVPFRGKIVLLHPSLLLGMGVDAGVSLGAAVVGLRERASCGAHGCPGQFSLENRVTGAPVLGAAMTFYPTISASFGVEGRVVPFASNPSGFYPGDRTWAANGMAAGFVAVHFPLEPRAPAPQR